MQNPKWKLKDFILITYLSIDLQYSPEINKGKPTKMVSLPKTLWMTLYTVACVYISAQTLCGLEISHHFLLLVFCSLPSLQLVSRRWPLRLFSASEQVHNPDQYNKRRVLILGKCWECDSGNGLSVGMLWMPLHTKKYILCANLVRWSSIRGVLRLFSTLA